MSIGHEPDTRTGSPQPWWQQRLDRLQSMRWSTAVFLLVGLLAVLVLVGLVFVLTGRSGEQQATSAPAPVGSPIDRASPRPPDNPALAPNDDPAADSAFGIEAQKLLDELRGHSVPFTDADANILVDIGDRNVARNEADLAAGDPQIAAQVAAAFPQYTEQQRADTTRCLAEYVEQTIAKNRGTTPPDSQDHN